MKKKEFVHTDGKNYKKPNMRIDIFDEDVSCDEIHLHSNLENQPGTGDDDTEEWDL